MRPLGGASHGEAKRRLSGTTAPARCSGCGAEFTGSAWTRLDLSTLLAPREIREHVLGWPDDVCVEVRVCSGCRALIAMKRSTVSP